MQSFAQALISKFNAFRHEWSKARQHMLAEKQCNIAYWRQRKDCNDSTLDTQTRHTVPTVE